MKSVRCYECGHCMTVQSYLLEYGDFVTSCIKCGSKLEVKK